MIDVVELVEITEEKTHQSVFKLGAVVELFDTGAAKVQLDGEEQPSQKEYTYLASYTPKLNDRVLLASVGGTYIILDAIYYRQTPNDSLGKLSEDISATNEEISTLKGNITTISGQLDQIDGTLGYKISSNMTDDVEGNMNIDYAYVNPTTKRLHVRRKNGEWTLYAPA